VVAFVAHKRVKGRKRHILVDTCGLLIACRVEPADVSDRRAASLLLGGLSPLFPNIRIVIADGGHQSRRFTRELLKQAGWALQIEFITVDSIDILRGQNQKETGLVILTDSERYACNQTPSLFHDSRCCLLVRHN
jgi:Transposase DDE domain